MSTIRLESIKDIYAALESDLITPSQAVSFTCKALKMLDIRIDGSEIKKENVLEQLTSLDNLLKSQPETPIFFFSQNDKDFNIKNVFDFYN